MKLHFGKNSFSTLSLLESQIQTLEYALSKTACVGDFDIQTQITIELGHLYNCKMLIIKTLQNESSTNKITNIKTYPSKINTEGATEETTDYIASPFLPALRKHYTCKQPAC